MNSEVEKHDYWLRSADFELATHAHIPASKNTSTAVLLCGTVGFEAIHAYRCMVRLGDALAEAGIAAFRFDFAGTGNSSGDATANHLVTAWQQNIIDQARDLQENWGFARITVVGFRLGAPLLTAVMNDLDVAGVTFWEPVTRGKAFVREIHAIAQFAEDPVPDSPDIVESGGFAFTADTIQSLAALSLNVEAVPAGVPVLLISRGRNARLNAESLGRQNRFEELRSREYDRMICEPHYTELPAESISCMERWHASIAKDDAPGHTLPELRHMAGITSSNDQCTVTESSFRTAAGKLFGIVTRPDDYLPGSTPTVVLSNAGSVCTTGPNRIYVQTARALAAAGLEVVRFDLRNLGDSVNGDVDAANAPYPDSAGHDASRLLEHCRTTLNSSSFVLAGLCSGSHTSYHYALTHDDPDVKAIVLINPLTYYYTPGMSLDNPLQHRTVRNAKSYARSARRAKNWRRLLTGQVNYGRLLRFAASVVLRLIRNGVRRVSSLWTRHPLSRMDEDLLRLQQRGLKVSFVFSDADPGYWIARVDSPNTFRKQVAAGEFDAIFIKDADHTMSRADNRKELIARLCELLKV